LVTDPAAALAPVLEYLGRYTHRVAIANERIVGIDGNDVLLRVRADPASGKKRVIRLPGVEFIGRFLQHVLPAGFKRIRHYGLLSPARKKETLTAARAALDVPPPQAAVIESVAGFLQRVTHLDLARCPYCESGRWRVVASLLPRRDRPNLHGPP
ncbi:MAG: transposase, partial [Propionivibrio sp.]